jgi:hypothetical protein
MDIGHYFTPSPVDFFTAPGQTHTVLGHFQTGYCDTAGIGGFAGRIKNFRIQKHGTAVFIRRHVAPSATAMHPFFISISASLPFISFWVAQEKARSQGTDQGRLLA